MITQTIEVYCPACAVYHNVRETLMINTDTKDVWRLECPVKCVHLGNMSLFEHIGYMRVSYGSLYGMTVQTDTFVPMA